MDSKRKPKFKVGQRVKLKVYKPGPVLILKVWPWVYEDKGAWKQNGFGYTFSASYGEDKTHEKNLCRLPKRKKDAR